MLTDLQIERYSRQIILQPVGGRGQEALLAAAVAVVGEHAAGDTTLAYLAAAGVGRLTRLAASAPTEPLNPDVTIDRRPMPGAPAALAALVSACALVVRIGTVGEIQPVYDACTVARRPLLWGFSTGSKGWIARLGTGTAHGCPACLGVALGAAVAPPGDTPLASVAAAWTGTLLASEALKILLRMPEALQGQYVTYDATAGSVALARLTPIGACGNGTAAPGALGSDRP